MVYQRISADRKQQALLEEGWLSDLLLQRWVNHWALEGKLWYAYRFQPSYTFARSPLAAEALTDWMTEELRVLITENISKNIGSCRKRSSMVGNNSIDFFMALNTGWIISSSKEIRIFLLWSKSHYLHLQGRCLTSNLPCSSYNITNIIGNVYMASGLVCGRRQCCGRCWDVSVVFGLDGVHSPVSRDGHLYTSPLLTIFSSNVYLYYTTSPAVLRESEWHYGHWRSVHMWIALQCTMYLTITLLHSIKQT